jgi:hypothetical protein
LSAGSSLGAAAALLLLGCQTVFPRAVQGFHSNLRLLVPASCVVCAAFLNPVFCSLLLDYYYLPCMLGLCLWVRSCSVVCASFSQQFPTFKYSQSDHEDGLKQVLCMHGTTDREESGSGSNCLQAVCCVLMRTLCCMLQSTVHGS